MPAPEKASLLYDYIVCGGGNAGCVVAARLAADPSVSVLLLEAGGPKDSVPASNIPAAVAQILGTEADWQIWSEPCKQLNGRKLHLGRGKFVGGTSGTNGTLCIRGSPEDYDSWRLAGWSGKEMHHYMSKAESFRSKPWFQANDSAHGQDGPIITTPHDNAPISDLVLQSFQSKGFGLVPDMFTTGLVSHGCGHAVRTVNQGVRTTAADYFRGDKSKSNITIETHVYVDSLILDDSAGTLRAAGVNAITSIGREKTSLQFRAKKEVILASGTYGSPAVLLRSGIGPQDELQKHGIKQVKDLPGVGKNLQDHLVMLSFYEVSKPGVTNDHKVWHKGGREQSIAQWKQDHTGFMSQFPFGSFAYARMDERLADSDLWKNAERTEGLDPMGLKPNQPHVEFWNTECYSPKYLYRDFPSDDKHAFSMMCKFFSPQSRGQLTLASTDPLANPIVDHNFLSDPLDMLLFSEACRLANEIVMTGEGTKDIVSGSWPANLTHHTFDKREQWEHAIRDRADTCYHPAGTCKMGHHDDPQAVVDEKLRVYGIEGLRIADASIIPKLMGGHPQMAVYGIGEKAADMIKAAMA